MSISATLIRISGTIIYLFIAETLLYHEGLWRKKRCQYRSRLPTLGEGALE